MNQPAPQRKKSSPVTAEGTVTPVSWKILPLEERETWGSFSYRG